jgi:hypothetical protein
MTDRSAVDTIKGYFYQFDMSILSLLRLENDSDSISIECIEDIDLQTATDETAVQCKYYAKTEYNHSVIKTAVQHMLTHYREVKDGLKRKMLYVIRGHYASGQDKLSADIDIDFLKNHFLTYTIKKVINYHHIALGLTDSDLAEFLTLLTVDIKALEFDKQFLEVIKHLQTTFDCNRFSAEFFYYNNALRVIKELSIKSTAVDRKITKKAFVERVNTSNILFNEWFVQKKGKKQHLAALRKEYFTHFNVSPFERFFLVEINSASFSRTELKELVFTLSKKWSKTSKQEPSPFCPYLFIQGITKGELLAFKKELVTEELKFVDGYDYQGADFSANSITLKASHSNGVKIKILNSLSNIEEIINVITKTREIYQFHLGQSYFDFTNAAINHVKIQVQNFSDIKEII